MFPTSEFKDYAKKHFVLVEADFPHAKPQSDALKKANQTLKTKYGVGGFPTLVIVDSEGKKLGQKVGYPPGSGTKAVIADLDKIIKK